MISNFRPLDPACLTAMQTPEQGKKLQGLFEEISQQLAFALSRPCPVFEDRYSVRVEFLDCIAWVALKVERLRRGVFHFDQAHVFYFLQI